MSKHALYICMYLCVCDCVRVRVCTYIYTVCVYVCECVILRIIFNFFCVSLFPSLRVLFCFSGTFDIFSFSFIFFLIFFLSLLLLDFFLCFGELFSTPPPPFFSLPFHSFFCLFVNTGIFHFWEFSLCLGGMFFPFLLFFFFVFFFFVDTGLFRYLNTGLVFFSTFPPFFIFFWSFRKYRALFSRRY